ncbi:MAG: N-acetylmuramoyl-L-alanine amidase CwlD [Candidatus Syntrophonatronum acetioxidans]|uniref:N-acetylmuramoyl-L-alanine amidase CwlD n=1 Tax=Candidatus Syntrophonatronum acetioxidans TaxID=1795816 RepID=A0A424YH66_9FIRM|nr:MAG: N-acetylmuramoyl-L-alanine amidase CwlD [Candidatus Syntrophonatronum acetioxidans]
MPLVGTSIIIDPGHGGYDPGVQVSGTMEKEINLEVALILRDFLQQGGAEVVMTREKDMDFLETSTGPKKRMDMKRRLEIIEGAKADIILSIHCNAIPSSRWAGAQTFYQEGREDGKILAEYVQGELIRVLKNTDRQVKGGNYFLLAQSSHPGVIVETGFLSNPQEASLLKNPGYREKVAWAIYGGILNYLLQS